MTPIHEQPQASPNPGQSTEAVPLGAQRKRIRSGVLELLRQPERGGVELARRHADDADRMVRALHLEVSRRCAAPPHLFGAVGGYGRRLLGLESDLDLCFLTEAPSEELSELVESMLYPLWDAGFEVGHQIVRIADAATDAQDELRMATELLDFRPLCGERSLLGALEECLWGTVFAQPRVETFIEQLQGETRDRHQQFGDSVYLLEPEVKNGTGGLRDLDFALWGARARLGTADLQRLAGLGVLSGAQLDATRRALDFHWTVRNHLHHSARRKTDRLTFDKQEVVAASMGYLPRDSSQMSEAERTGNMVEAFMSDYYRHARSIVQVRDRILGHARRRPRDSRPQPQALGDGLVSCEGRIGLEAPRAALTAEPALALRVYAIALQRGTPLLSRTRDAIALATEDEAFCERLRNSADASRYFVALLCSLEDAPFAKGSVVGELHDVGLLLAMIPEFAPVVGRVHHDLYHVYTVDVHSVSAVDRLRTVMRGDMVANHPLASRVGAEVARPAVLFLATLLHDVGKDTGGKDHPARGAVLGRRILTRLGVTPQDIDDVCHLIAEHLTMYMVALRRDLSDPEVIEDFARVVRTREGLRHLYLLTISDLSTTGTAAMTDWKAGMLIALFRATDVHLSGRQGDASTRAQRVRAEVRALWTDRERAAALDHYLGSMPERYFLSNSAPEIAAHAELAVSARDGSMACAVVPTRQQDLMGPCVVSPPQAGRELCVVASDRPGLLAAITAAISAQGLTIRSAQVHSRPLPDGSRQAVDIFWLEGGGPDHERDAQKLQHLQRDLRAIVDGDLSPSVLMQPPSRPSWSERALPAVPVEVLFDHHGSSEHTIMEVISEDRFGLLFTLARVLHSLDLTISLAKVSTEGMRAIDVFYVSEADGSKLQPGDRTEEVRTALHESLAPARAS